MLTVLLLLMSVGAGIIGGVFFAFSNFVMKALAELPARNGVAAMQRINVVVLNPPFLAVFVGTAVLGLVCVAVAAFGWVPDRPWLMVGAGLSYAIGTFGVTMIGNVPRNERLARLQPDSADASGYWATYVGEWLFWNHVRTVAAVASAAMAALALAE